jgi:dTDP-4-dehydrorhamnose 3,5-epimerase-like enzyme
MNQAKMNVRYITFPTNSDARGSLTSIETLFDIPFEIKRIFYMHHITGERGGHAHIDTDQLVIPMYGSFEISVFDGKNTQFYFMDEATKGLYIPRLIYTELYDFSDGAVCLVLANTHYDIKKSLRNKTDYLKYLNSNYHV